MNSMKLTLAGLIAAAAVLPASAAVVNYTWAGAGGVTISGQITYTGAGAITEADVSAMTFSLSGTGGFDESGSIALTHVNGNLDISFNSGTLVQSGAFNAYAPSANELFFSGTAGGAGSWTANDGGFNWTDGDGDTALTLTAVPEPELMAAVAGLGLVAFGVARRRFAKA